MNFAMLMTGAALSSFTVIPKQASVHLHYLDRDYSPTTSCPSGKTRVTGPRFVENGLNQEGRSSIGERDPLSGDGLSKKENSFCLSTSELLKEREWAKSVYRAHVGSGTKNQGTAFLIAHNIVMTNNHVVAPKAANPTDCRAFEVQTRTEQPKWVTCKKIIYCNPRQDFCFVEMNPVSPGVNLGDLSRPLPLKASAIIDQQASIIGNSGALGLQGSRGKVITDAATLKRAKVLGGTFIHMIPMIGGASGSPILNRQGEVIGINHSHAAFDGKENHFVDPNGDTFNIGTSMNFVMSDFMASTLLAPYAFQLAPETRLKILAAFKQ